MAAERRLMATMIGQRANAWVQQKGNILARGRAPGRGAKAAADAKAPKKATALHAVAA